MSASTLSWALIHAADLKTPMRHGWGNLAAPLGRLMLIGLTEVASENQGHVEDFQAFCERLGFDVRMGNWIVWALDEQGLISIGDYSQDRTDDEEWPEVLTTFYFTLEVS